MQRRSFVIHQFRNILSDWLDVWIANNDFWLKFSVKCKHTMAFALHWLHFSFCTRSFSFIGKTHIINMRSLTFVAYSSASLLNRCNDCDLINVKQVKTMKKYVCNALASTNSSKNLNSVIHLFTCWTFLFLLFHKSHSMTRCDVVTRVNWS